eukprot:CAMPEP_0177632118 /NCGR_PEP_ID=MMETSP0447-20121125/2115_1 /TAXON_ID=0 /ORGANISM="Stygamoeba regulata, Strain BSH-02190019" /LENGTH=59 /DNA_ID=CAMNT_0019133653 /DNA_START=514 /DNA_END=690 /DNA_ORIENTATION=-
MCEAITCLGYIGDARAVLTATCVQQTACRSLAPGGCVDTALLPAGSEQKLDAVIPSSMT